MIAWSGSGGRLVVMDRRSKERDVELAANQSYTSAVALLLLLSLVQELRGDCLARRLFCGNGKKLDCSNSAVEMLVGVRIASLICDNVVLFKRGQ
jgi:hypothetical protein